LAKGNSTAKWTILCQLVTPGLILVLPLVNYCVFLGYPWTSPEFLLANAAAMLLGGLAGLLILLRPGSLAPILYPVLILLSLDLQFGIEGLIGVIGGTNAKAGAVLSTWPLLSILGAFIAVSLLVKLAGEKASTILFAIFAVMAISTPLVGERLDAASKTVAPVALTPERDLPPIVYLVLDEHGGLSGLPREYPETAAMAATLERFYEAAGFRLYMNAFSQYYETLFSLSDILAIEPPTDFGDLHDTNKDHYVLESNRLFAALAARGYRLRVYQSDYFDFCQTSRASIAGCKTYQRSNVVDIRKTGLGAMERTMVLLTTFASRSLTYQTLYRLVYASAAQEAPATPPTQRFRLGASPNFGAIPSLQAIDEITASLSHNPRGVAYFAHLLIPHRTFLLDKDCEVSWPMERWHLGFEAIAERFNNHESRRAGYYAYIDQLTCLYKKLGALVETIDANPDLHDAVLIFQGDHGSRIAFRQDAAFDDPGLLLWEKLDMFSALYAVRTPAIAPGIDRRELFLRDILTEVMAQLWPGCDGTSQADACNAK
jgi:hypothetical protein